ncbi:ribosome-associated GTPase [Streptococcus pneumoniae]|nr:ribosome-associated GTPase [Streptococcus pneumoniae]
MSVKEPDFNSNLLDRFLVLLEHKGIHPIVYISKMDLLEDRGELDFYRQTYGDIGYDFVTSKNSKTHPDKIEVLKYCPKERKVTLHLESK